MNSATLFATAVDAPSTVDIYAAAAIVFAAIVTIWPIKKVIGIGNRS